MKKKLIVALILGVIINDACMGMRNGAQYYRSGAHESVVSLMEVNKQAFKDLKTTSMGVAILSGAVKTIGSITGIVLSAGGSAIKKIKALKNPQNSDGILNGLVDAGIVAGKEMLKKVAIETWDVTKSGAIHLGKIGIRTAGKVALGYYAQPVAYKVLSLVVPGVCNSIVSQLGMNYTACLVNSNPAISMYTFYLSSVVATWSIIKGQQWFYNQNADDSKRSNIKTNGSKNDNSQNKISAKPVQQNKQTLQANWKTDILKPLGLSVFTFGEGAMVCMGSWALGGVSQPLGLLCGLWWPHRKFTSIIASGLATTYVVELYDGLSESRNLLWKSSWKYLTYGLLNTCKYLRLPIDAIVEKV